MGRHVGFVWNTAGQILRNFYKTSDSRERLVFLCVFTVTIRFVLRKRNVNGNKLWMIHSIESRNESDLDYNQRWRTMEHPHICYMMGVLYPHSISRHYTELGFQNVLPDPILYYIKQTSIQRSPQLVDANNNDILNKWKLPVGSEPIFF